MTFLTTARALALLSAIAVGCSPAPAPAPPPAPASVARPARGALCAPTTASLHCPTGSEPAFDRPAPAWPSGADLLAARPRAPWIPPISDRELGALVRRDEQTAKLGAAARARLGQADGAYGRHDWKSARAAYASFVASSPANGPLRAYAQYRLAEALTNLGKYPEAIRELTPLSSQMADEPGLARLSRADLVSLHAEVSDAPVAREALSKLDDAPLDELARAYVDRGRPREARQIYELGLRDAPAERRCAIQSRLTQLTMLSEPQSTRSLELAARAQIEAQKALREGPFPAAAKLECSRATVALVSEMAAAAQVEAVGSDGQKGTGDRRTSALASTLERLLLDGFQPRELDELAPAAFVDAKLPLSFALAAAQADLVAYLKNWRDCGPAYERAAELWRAESPPPRIAFGAARCYAEASRQAGWRRPAASVSDTPEPFTALDEKVLASSSRYLCSVEPGDSDPFARARRVFVELARGRVFYDRRQLREAVAELREPALAGPEWDGSVTAAELELEALAALRSNQSADPCRTELLAARERLLDLFCEGEREAAPADCDKLRATGAARIGASAGGVRQTRPRPIPLDRTSVSGTTIPATVLRILRLQRGRFEACYRTALRRDPTLGGHHETSFAIARDGSVKDVRSQRSTLADAGLVACIEGVFSSLSFPQPEGGSPHAKYAMELGPASGVGELEQLEFRVVP